MTPIFLFVFCAGDDLVITSFDYTEFLYSLPIASNPASAK